ncbi:MAG: hypothetical protein MZV64_30435 [Ignavibacteriales bacterium]|nr:hypothetical protein [Ignavibacteriales bacterium]
MVRRWPGKSVNQIAKEKLNGEIMALLCGFGRIGEHGCADLAGEERRQWRDDRIMKIGIAEHIKQSLEFTSGCTEPAAIAYTASYAGKYLDGNCDAIELFIDPKTYKNAFGVGIPNGSGHTGSEWAVVFGFLVARPDEAAIDLHGPEHRTHRESRILVARDAVRLTITDHEKLHVRVLARGRGRGRSVDRGLPYQCHPDFLQRRRLYPKDCRGYFGFHGLLSPISRYDWEKWPALIEDALEDPELLEIVKTGCRMNLRCRRSWTNVCRIPLPTSDSRVRSFPG